MKEDDFFSGADATTNTGLSKLSNTVKAVNDSGLLNNAEDLFASLKKKPTGSGVQTPPPPTVVQLNPNAANAGMGKGQNAATGKSNTMLYVGIGVGVLLVGGIILWAVTKKK